MVTSANTGETIVITAIGHLSKTFRGTYSVPSGRRNCIGENKHNNVPKTTTKRRYKV
jgi:hypothetical protein